MRPPGPVPETPARSTARSNAIFFARGEALKRGPPAFAAGRGFGVRGVGDVGAGFGVGAGAGAGFAAETEAALAATGLAGEESPLRTASRSPTLTTPPSGTIISVSVPSSNASISIVALSVSTSARMSPISILSPAFFSHLTSVPSFMVSLNFGIVMSGIGIGMVVVDQQISSAFITTRSGVGNWTGSSAGE